MERSGFKDEWDDLDDDESMSALIDDVVSAEPQPAAEDKKAAAAKQVAAADSAARKQGFAAPRKMKKKKAFRRSENLRTGRNETISMKGRGEDKDRLTAISDDREWVNGQTFQYALDALAEKIANPKDPFWETRNYHGVE